MLNMSRGDFLTFSMNLFGLSLYEILFRATSSGVVSLKKRLCSLGFLGNLEIGCSFLLNLYKIVIKLVC